jgi:CRP-like cAMP-binding protein
LGTGIVSETDLYFGGVRQSERTCHGKKATKVFDPKVFLATVNGGRTIVSYRKREVIFAQGKPADTVFYIQKG